MTYEITHKQRLELLEAHNNLRTALSNVSECQDLWLSDVNNLDKLQYSLHRIFKFVPKEDEDGRSMYWGAWVLSEEDSNDD